MKCEFLKKLIQNEQLEWIDYFVAKTILKNISSATECHAIFLAYLSYATREGNLCVKLQKDSISPDPSPELAKLSTKIIEGAKTLPINQIENWVHHWKGHYYFQRYWNEETQFINAFTQFINQSYSYEFDITKFEKEINNLHLSLEQKTAVNTAFQSRLTIINGGPGTGKTYTAGKFLALFWSMLPEDEKQQFSISIAAPTGKAAANLSKSLESALSSSVNFPTIEPKTLHSLLGARRFHNDMPCINADLVIVDEASMIPANMMTILLESLKPSAKLILLGDASQLPPIETGSVFAEMIVMLEKKQKSLVTLSECKRVENQSLQQAASVIKDGKEDQFLSLLKSNVINQVPLPKTCDDFIHSTISNFTSPEIFSNCHYSKLLQSYQNFRILTPLRKGPFGVENLNKKFLKTTLHNLPSSSPLIYPIIITKNDYRMNLFNGDVGLIISKTRKFSYNDPDDIVCLWDWKSNDLRTFPALLLPKFELAYALSVHKSQGSEYDHVFVILPQGSERFGKELLYTAITRAKKTVTLSCEEEMLRIMLKNHSLRVSGILNRLDQSAIF